ncbi:hypothetical protein B0H13DRAFT_2341162 [Mycena leptocephala]|nr:hypothetical protein B0H13DRAFT_2341162 [Mycena leptocephala]
MDDLDFVIGRLLNEELRQETDYTTAIGSSSNPMPVALAARTYRDKSRVTCWKCRKLGHFQNECPEPGPLVSAAPVAANITETTRDWPVGVVVVTGLELTTAA